MLVGDVLLQTLLAAEQLVTFVTLEQLVTWEDAHEGCVTTIHPLHLNRFSFVIFQKELIN